jgi:RNA polymerase sigma-70 factor (ECF subfamily)
MADDRDLKTLVSLARKGDTDAFGTLVSRFSAAVRAQCLLRAADSARADDIAQQVFLTAWRRLPDLSEDGAFWPWLDSITRRHLLNEWRRVQRERGLKQRYTVQWLSKQETDEAVADNADELAGRVDSLRLCLDKLPPELRKLVKMRYDDKCTSQTIGKFGKLMGRSADSIRQTFVRVREKLRECIERRLGESLTQGKSI